MLRNLEKIMRNNLHKANLMNDNLNDDMNNDMNDFLKYLSDEKLALLLYCCHNTALKYKWSQKMALNQISKLKGDGLNLDDFAKAFTPLLILAVVIIKKKQFLERVFKGYANTSHKWAVRLVPSIQEFIEDNTGKRFKYATFGKENPLVRAREELQLGVEENNQEESKGISDELMFKICGN
jgi:hypothetical protein